MINDINYKNKYSVPKCNKNRVEHVIDRKI